MKYEHTPELSLGVHRPINTVPQAHVLLSLPSFAVPFRHLPSLPLPSLPPFPSPPVPLFYPAHLHYFLMLKSTPSPTLTYDVRMHDALHISPHY